MALHWPPPGCNDVGSYQIAGVPWVTASVVAAGSPLHIRFPMVTNFVFIRNTSALASTVRIGFTQNGVMGNPASQSRYMELDQNEETPVLPLRITELFLSGTAGLPRVQVVVGLTLITDDKFPILTGSLSGSFGLFEGVG